MVTSNFCLGLFIFIVDIFVITIAKKLSCSIKVGLDGRVKKCALIEEKSSEAP